MGGLIAALWKIGVLDRLGPAWSAIGFAIGLGIMLSVAMGETKTVEVEEKH